MIITSKQGEIDDKYSYRIDQATLLYAAGYKCSSAICLGKSAAPVCSEFGIVQAHLLLFVILDQQQYQQRCAAMGCRILWHYK